jgi:DNA-binding NarL/FixJ family response regulator/tetratricopeptide (TPR) repeat protein
MKGAPIIRTMTSRLVSPIVVGRERELAVVDAALDGALSGRAGHLLIAGEAGVGKSRLVEEAVRAATERGMEVLRGSCVNIGPSGVPYGPIVEALRDLPRDLTPDEVAAVVGHSGPDLARLLPALVSADELPEVTVQSQWLQARLLEALLGLVQRLASMAPLLLVIEDLHWADPGTRETLTYLIRNLRTDPTVLLVTYRSDELHRRHPLLPWLAEIQRMGGVERIELARFSPSETRELLVAILGEDPRRDLAEHVFERSDGNPFFIEELVMADRTVSQGRAIPPTLRGILLARIEALPDAARSVVGVAAVAGRRVDHDLLAAVIGRDEDTTLASLREAVSQQVLVAYETGASEGYAFRHALMQEAAYDDLLPGERRRLHRAFAEALGGRVAGAGAAAAMHWVELAYHWMAARGDRRALDASMRAATASVDAYAFADALHHYESVLELWSSLDDPEEVTGVDHAAILDAASTVAAIDGQPQRSMALREAAVAELDADADPVRAALWQERLGRVRWLAGETAGSLRAYEEAVTMVPAEPLSPARARVLSGYGQILMLLDRWEESGERCEEALRLARASGDRQVEGHALCSYGLDLAAMGRTEEGIAALEDAHRIAVEIGNIDDIGRASVNLANALQVTGYNERAADVVRAGIAEARELGIASSYGAYLAHQGTIVLYELGEWQAAADMSADAFATEHLELHADRYGLARLVPLLVSSGDEHAELRLDQLGHLLEGGPAEGQFWAPYHTARAEYETWQGHPDVALSGVRSGYAAIADISLYYYKLRLLRIGARAAADLADQARARRDKALERSAREGWDELDARLRPLLAQTYEMHHGPTEAEARAEAATIEAELARLRAEPQVDAWRDAVARWIERRRPYLLAYSRWRLAEALLADGDRGAAAAELVEAHRVAADLGALPLKGAVESLAARARIDLVPVGDAAAVRDDGAAKDPFRLTPREREVLALVSVGRTNRQIADELFISESTAGVHVSNILGKLGVASRTEAAGVAVRLGLAAD